MFLWRCGGNQGSRERDDAGAVVTIGSKREEECVRERRVKPGVLTQFSFAVKRRECCE